ncbi:MAG TPA: PilC/PilY family type IV pilus protein [Burkholderiaceae bacterium]
MLIRVMIYGLLCSNSWGATPEVKIPNTPLFACASAVTLNANPKFDGDSGMSNLAGVSLSTIDLSNSTGFIFRSSFHPSKWSGSFKKYALTLDSNGIPQIGTAASWDAADILTGVNQHMPDPTPDNRKIYTSRIESDKTLETIEFKWNNLSSNQKATLNKSPTDGKSDGLGEKRLNYLRGVRSLEQGKIGGLFRTRDSVLGDIVSSNSVYVGAPALNGQGSGYQKFYDANKNRGSAVYVGANDGMLHAFDVETGRELFSYIPNILLPALNQLTHPNYAHRPYADGSLAVSDTMVEGVWKTILAAGMGGGAQGVYALDVTNPSDFGSGAGVLWEFTDADDSDMGNQMAAPMIAKFKVGTVDGVPEYKYFVVVSSGLNNYKADGESKYDASGEGALFLLSLDKAPSEKWKRNVNYFRFKTPITDSAMQNGLSVPALAIGSNGAVRYVYAGDLQGNLWRFDFTGNAPWPHALSSDTPIFTAKDWHGVSQPITTQPKIVFAPGGGYVVLFGTGKYIEEADTIPAEFKEQSFYGIYDTTKKQDVVKSRSQLELRTLVSDFSGVLKIAGNDFSYGTTSESKQGWYLDFSDSEHTGERSITNSITISGKLFFNTLLPGIKQCGEGSGRSYTLDALTGLSSGGDNIGYVSQIGVLSMPMIFQATIPQNDKSPLDNARSNDKNKNKNNKKKNVVINFGTGGPMGIMEQSKIGNDDLNSAIAGSGSFGWREILNWKELRDAASNK